MAAKSPLLLLDTNVWLDYFDSSRAGFDSAVALVRFARKSGIGLLVAATSLKDFYYQTAHAVKRDVRESGQEVTPEIAAAAEEFAWSCTQSLMEVGAVASIGDADARMTRSIHRLHRDFEDDLVISVAMRCDVSYLVTSDKRLAAKSPVPTLSAADTLEMLNPLT